MASTSVRDFLADSAVRRRVLDDYRRSGLAILTDVYSPSEIAQMRQTWSEIGEVRRREGKKPHATLLMTHLSNVGIASTVRHPNLVGAIEGLLGGKVELIQSQLMFGQPGTKGFSPHQDNFYNRAEPKDGIIAAWIALEDVDESNGCLAVFPGSHLNGLAETRRDWIYLLSRSPDVARSLLRLASPAARGQPNDSGVIERYVYAEIPKDIQPLSVVLEAGSVAFMHGDLIHLSYPNRTADRFRRSLLTNFVREGTKFNAGKLTGRIPFDVYAS
jgi:ectoine hydroxylase-related dioxygenase (phytanoyl-CoA dioxygenase family)